MATTTSRHDKPNVKLTSGAKLSPAADAPSRSCVSAELALRPTGDTSELAADETRRNLWIRSEISGPGVAGHYRPVASRISGRRSGTFRHEVGNLGRSRRGSLRPVLTAPVSAVPSLFVTSEHRALTALTGAMRTGPYSHRQRCDRGPAAAESAQGDTR